MGSQEGRAPVRVVDGTLLLPWSLMSFLSDGESLIPCLVLVSPATELSLSNQSTTCFRSRLDRGIAYEMIMVYLVQYGHSVKSLSWVFMEFYQQVVLIQRTTNTAADFLAKYAVERNIAHMELLRPLNNMQTVLSYNPSSSSVRS
ncbi:hypothetical protein PIB30_036723 [Stylosanthes scabra]|uniref:RNase H type-1 domain-containing protein n=1 Tax=Stylosanthes scabra TaxID=79078 RepID=A0ABU6QCZ4_9FABA|nr:hypothetical protein [Stylosanthes scabra]